MAATVEGVFRVLDRATDPMQRMERQAQKLDRALARAGRSMDQAFGTRRIRQIETADRAMRNFDRTAGNVSRTMRNVDRSMESTSRSTRRTVRDVGLLERGFRKLLIVTGGLMRVMSFFKWPAIGAAIGIVVQAVGALTAGVVALVPQLVGAIGAVGALIPQLVQLGGVAGALPATLTGVALAVVTTKFAFADLSEALGGNERALERLTPQARAFMRTLQQYQPVLNTLRGTAQTGLFAGLDFSVRRLQRGVPVVNSLLRDMSRTLGQAAARASTRFTQRGFLQDILGIGRQGTRLVGSGLDAATNLADALRHVAVTAQPFTDWLRRTVVSWSEYILGASIAGRETGRLARFFDRTRAVMTRFGHIARDVFMAMRNIGRAMRPAGDSMWRGIERAARAFRDLTGSTQGQARMRLWFERAADAAARMWRIIVNLGRTMVGLGRASRSFGDNLWNSFDRATRRWAEFTNSIGGQITLTRWFNSTERSVYAILGLFTDLGMAIARMGADPALGDTVDRLRRMVPVLERILTVLANAFGPPMLEALLAIGRTLENLSGVTGPLTVVLTLFTRILNIINEIIDRVPALGVVVTTALSVIAINFFIGRVIALARAWMGVAGAASTAAAAQAVATGGAAAGGRGRGRGGVFGRVLGGGALLRGAGAIGIAGIAAAAVMNARYPSDREFENTATGWRGFIPGGGWLWGRRENPTSRFIREGAFGRHLQHDLSGLGGDNPQTANQVARQIEVFQRFHNMLRGNATRTAQAQRDALMVEIVARQQVLEQMRAQERMQRRIQTEAAVRQSNTRARRLLGQYGRRFDLTAQHVGAGGAMTETTSFVLRDLEGLRPEGRRILANNVLAWAAEAARTNPALRDEYETMVTSIEDRFKELGTNVEVVNGRVLERTERTWKLLANSLGSHAERGKERVTAAFQAIRDQAISALTGMGFSPGAARQLIANVEAGMDPGAARGAAASGMRYEGMAGMGMGANGRRDGPGYYMGSGSGGNVVDIGRKLQAMGYQVGEHPAFGGVAPVHTRNSWHYKGMAIDVNADGFPGGEGAALDRIYPWLARLGPTELLWRTQGHYDHLHLAMGGPGSYIAGGVGPGGVGFSPISLTAPSFGMSGALGLLGQTATSAFAAGLGQKVNEAAFGGWFGGGGDFVARRPTLIGVGESGEERVTITPRGRGGGGVRIGRIIIQNHREGDIRRQIESEVAEAFHNLSGMLESQPLVGDSEVLS